MQNNGSIYLHAVVTKHGHSIDPADRESHSPLYVFSKTKRKWMIFLSSFIDRLTVVGLNKYKKKVYKKTKNLLTGSTEQDEEYQKVNFSPIHSRRLSPSLESRW